MSRIGTPNSAPALPFTPQPKTWHAWGNDPNIQRTTLHLNEFYIKSLGEVVGFAVTAHPSSRMFLAWFVCEDESLTPIPTNPLILHYFFLQANKNGSGYSRAAIDACNYIKHAMAIGMSPEGYEDHEIVFRKDFFRRSEPCKDAPASSMDAQAQPTPEVTAGSTTARSGAMGP